MKKLIGLSFSDKNAIKKFISNYITFDFDAIMSYGCEIDFSTGKVINSFTEKSIELLDSNNRGIHCKLCLDNPYLENDINIFNHIYNFHSIILKQIKKNQKKFSGFFGYHDTKQ